MRLALRILALVTLALALLGLWQLRTWFAGNLGGDGRLALGQSLNISILLFASLAATLVLGVLAVVAASTRRQWGWLAAMLLVTVASVAVVYIANTSPARTAPILDRGVASYHEYVTSFVALLAPPLLGLVYSFRVVRGPSRAARAREAALVLLALAVCYVALFVLGALLAQLMHVGVVRVVDLFILQVLGVVAVPLGLGVPILAGVLAYRRREWGWLAVALGAVLLNALSIVLAVPLSVLVFRLRAFGGVTGGVLSTALTLAIYDLPPVLSLAYAVYAVRTTRRASPPAESVQLV